MTQKFTSLTAMTPEFANTFFRQHLGLMFRKPGDYEMVFSFAKPSNIRLHTFFMRFPIDVSFIGEKGVLKEIRMDPWRVVRMKGVTKVIERSVV